MQTETWYNVEQMIMFQKMESEVKTASSNFHSMKCRLEHDTM